MKTNISKLISSDLIYPKIGINFLSKYRFGKLTKFYDRSEELKELKRGNNFIESLKGKYKGKRCFIIGNGPSLNKQDLTFLKDEFTIGSNYIYMNYEKMGFYPSIFTIVNYLVAEQRIDEINNLQESIKVFPYFLNYCIKKDERTFFLNSAAVKEFSTDVTKNISWQSTVTFFNMQLAYYLGFDEVYLIGVDNSYIQPKDGKEGAMIDQKEDDKNHFCGTYFKGLTWQKADTDAMEYVYYLTKEVFDKSKQNIYNATHGGRLEVFERVNYESLFTHKSATKKENKVLTNSLKKETTTLISINPDLENKFGHFLHYDMAVSSNLNTSTKLIIFGKKSIDEDLQKVNRNIIPSFSNNTWDIGRRHEGITFKTKKFKYELLNSIRIVNELNRNNIYYLYTGSINHAMIIKDIVDEYPETGTFHINLFWEHFNVEYIENNKDKIIANLQKINQSKQINLYIDSDEMNFEFKRLLNKTFTRWPMFPVTNFTVNSDTLLIKKNNNLNIVFPGNLRIEKGFDMAVSCANELSKKANNVFIRSALININDSKVEAIVNTINKKVNIIEGVLSEEEYLGLMKSADIIVLPYRVSEFKTRTSGLMADAIYLSKPVVAAKGTFMGNIIEKYGNGEVFIDGDSKSMLDAVERVISSHKNFVKNAQQCEREWKENNNISDLIENTFSLSKDSHE